MTTKTATYHHFKIEARQGDDGLYRAYVNGELKADTEPARGGRALIKRVVKALQNQERERFAAMDWSQFLKPADSPDLYTEDELKQMLKAFEGTDALTVPGVPFSYNEIGRALLRLDNIKGALEG